MRNRPFRILETAARAIGARLRQARALGASPAECDAVLRQYLDAYGFAQEALRAPEEMDAARALRHVREAARLARYLAGRAPRAASVRASIERALARARATYVSV